MTTLNTSQPPRAADQAEKRLNDHSLVTGPHSALQGIGYALLAVVAQLADNNTAVIDIGDKVTDIAAHLEQLTITADDLSATAEARGRRAWWPRRRRSPKPGNGPESCQRCGAPGDDVALWTLAPGLAECLDIRACLARRAGQTVLSAADVATVRQALADAKKWVSMVGTPYGDQVTAYATLRDRLAPAGTEGA
jgi:hypothetical protein